MSICKLLATTVYEALQCIFICNEPERMRHLFEWDKNMEGSGAELKGGCGQHWKFKDSEICICKQIWPYATLTKYDSYL